MVIAVETNTSSTRILILIALLLFYVVFHRRIRKHESPQLLYTYTFYHLLYTSRQKSALLFFMCCGVMFDCNPVCLYFCYTKNKLWSLFPLFCELLFGYCWSIRPLQMMEWVNWQFVFIYTLYIRPFIIVRVKLLRNRKTEKWTWRADSAPCKTFLSVSIVAISTAP